MKKKLYLFLLLIFPLYLTAQDTTGVEGFVTDSSGSALQEVTISLQRANDSVSVKNATTDSTGYFRLNNIAHGAYRVTFSYLGLEPTSRLLTVTDSTLFFNLDTVKLYNGYSEMNEVVVYASRPITIKGDTTEYNITQLGIKPNATAEDALKKLAGVEVDNTGAIKVQGENVKRVYVNGKRFFGDDPKMATQNLPADVIEKIQVFDAKSDQAEFTGISDGNDSKTINIVTRSNTRNGSFGKLTVSGGSDLSKNNNTNKLYAIGGNYNRFRNDEQLSIVGQLNNTNQQMFTMPGDMGGGRGMSNGPNSTGQTRTLAAGINYRNKFKKTEVYGNYFYNNTDLDIYQDRFTQNFLKNDTLQNTLSNSYSNRKRVNHSFNFNSETKIDSLRTLIVRPTLSFQYAENYTQSQNNIYRTFSNDTLPISNSNINNNNSNDGFSGGLELTYRQRLKKLGRTCSVNTSLTGASNDGEGYNYNDIHNVRTGRNTLTNQYFTNTTDRKAISATVSYTEPIAKNQLVELNLNYSYNDNNADRQTFNFDSASMDYTKADSILTNKFKNTYNSQRATLTYQYNNQTINFSAGSGLQYGEMNSINESKHYEVHRNYRNFYPTVNFSYRFPNSKNLRFNYNGRTQQPSISQLQPVLDNSNQLYIVDGNPDLDQSFNHNFRLSYGSFNRRSNKNMFLMVNATFTQNAIINSITTLANGGQYIKPVNMDGPYSINGFFNFGFPINKPKSNINLSTNLSHSRAVSQIDSIINNTYTTSIGEQIRWNTNLKETFDINFSTRPTYNFASYTVNKNQDGNYYSQSIAFDGTWYTKSGWITNVLFDYTFYTGLENGYNVGIPLLNASVSKQLFKNKAGELKLSVNDLLNQNKSIVNTRTDNYIQQTRSNVLQRYFMLSFIYNLKNFSGKMPGGDRERRWRDGGDEGSRPPRPPFGGGGGGDRGPRGDAL